MGKFELRGNSQSSQLPERRCSCCTQTMQADWGVLASRKLGGGPNFSAATYSGMVRPAYKFGQP
jgi:hypothetical protein